MFRKRAEVDEAIDEDLLAQLPEIGEAPKLTVLHVETVDDDPLKPVREALTRADQGLSLLARRVKDLEGENARLVARLRDAEAKAALLDEVRASLNRAP